MIKNISVIILLKHYVNWYLENNVKYPSIDINVFIKMLNRKMIRLENNTLEEHSVNDYKNKQIMLSCIVEDPGNMFHQWPIFKRSYMVRILPKKSDTDNSIVVSASNYDSHHYINEGCADVPFTAFLPEYKRWRLINKEGYLKRIHPYGAYSNGIETGIAVFVFGDYLDKNKDLYALEITSNNPSTGVSKHVRLIK